MAEALRSTANGRSPGRLSGSARASRAACALLLCVLLQGCATTAMWRSLDRPDDAPVQWDNDRLDYAACEITAIRGGTALLVQISTGADTTVAYECAPAEGYERRFAELLERTDSKELRIDEFVDGAGAWLLAQGALSPITGKTAAEQQLRSVDLVASRAATDTRASGGRVGSTTLTWSRRTLLSSDPKPVPYDALDVTWRVLLTPVTVVLDVSVLWLFSIRQVETDGVSVWINN